MDKKILSYSDERFFRLQFPDESLQFGNATSSLHLQVHICDEIMRMFTSITVEDSPVYSAQSQKWNANEMRNREIEKGYNIINIGSLLLCVYV